MEWYQHSVATNSGQLAVENKRVAARRRVLKTGYIVIRGPRIIAVAGNRGHLWGEQHRIETRTKRNHSRVNSGRLTIGGNYSRSPLLNQPIWLSANGRRARLGRIPITGIPADRKFPDKFTINQAAALPEFI